MGPGACPQCGTEIDVEIGDRVECPECGFAGSTRGPGPGSGSSPWRLLEGAALTEKERAFAHRSLGLATRLGAATAFAVGLGLILVGVGNGVWRLTTLGTLSGPGGALGFLFHLLTAAILVLLGATLLPLALNLGSGDRAEMDTPVLLFSLLWAAIGFSTIFLAPISPANAVGAGIVLLLAGAFGAIATTSYNPGETGSGLLAGVLGLVAGGLLIGGVASIPASLAGTSQFGAELLFRYGDPLHASGYLVAILAAAIHPFVRASRNGRAGILMAVCLGGLLWGIGELFFTSRWLASAPWQAFPQLGAGASAAYGFVFAGGLSTILGGLAGLGAALTGIGYASVPLRAAMPTGSGAATVTCTGCGSAVDTTASYCPDCGDALEQPAAG